MAKDSKPQDAATARRPKAGKAAGKKKKTFKKRGEKRVVHHGFAHIQASFNNTIVTITDAEGQRDRLVERRRHRLQGIAQGHAVRGDAGGDGRGQRRQDLRHAVARGARQGPGRRPRVGDPRAADGRARREVDPRRHADSAQRLPAAEAAAGLDDDVATRIVREGSQLK